LPCFSNIAIGLIVTEFDMWNSRQTGEPVTYALDVEKRVFALHALFTRESKLPTSSGKGQDLVHPKEVDIL